MDTNQTNNNTTGGNGNNMLLSASLIIGALIIGGAILWNGSHPTGPGGAPTPKADIKKVNTDGDPFIGKADAAVTIAFWSDFQCPFCKKFEVETLPLIIKEYVNTGKVKIVFMDFAFLGPDSTDAALYNRAVWKLYPNKYFEWRTAMYEAQDEERGGFGNAASIDKLNAAIAGIDAAKIASDVQTNKAAYTKAIDADKADAQKSGISATPSFVIGTEAIMGAYPYENFKTAIDAVLK